MFGGTVLERPNAEQQADLLDSDGALYDWEYVCSGAPLVNHERWFKGDTQASGDDHLGWKLNGENIYVLTQPPRNAANLHCHYLEKESYVMEGTLHIPSNFDATTSSCWLVPFTKMIDANNMVGLRVNTGTIECVTREGGRWGTVDTTGWTIPAYDDLQAGMYWVVQFNGDKISCWINDSFVGELTIPSSLITPSYFGISSHRYEITQEEILFEGFKGYELTDDIVTHNGLRVTNQGEVVRYNP